MNDNDQYKMGDVANGHVLTAQGWMPLAGAHVATTEAPKKSRRGLKILGMGAAGLLGISVIGGALGGGESSTESTGSSSSTSSSTSSSSDDDTEKASAGIGDEVRDGKFAFTVTDVETGASTYGDGFLTEEAQGEFTIITMTVENVGDEAQMLDATNMEGIDSEGRELAAEMGLGDAFLENINPGNSVTVEVAFDVAKGATLDSVVVHDSMFSAGAPVNLS